MLYSFSNIIINSVQYPNLMSAVEILELSTLLVGADFTDTLVSNAKSETLPLRTSKAPVNTVTRPCPPESTTPASFNTGSISGVRSNISCIAFKTSSQNSIKSSVSPANSPAFVAPAFATVKIVPSFGFITAL